MMVDRIAKGVVALSLAVAFMLNVSVNTASAGFIEKRYFAVSPAMMHAIEVIISEHAKMMRHKMHR